MIPEYVIAAVLILQMGSADYRVRELATKKLGEHPTDILVWHFGVMQAKKDPEIRRRLGDWPKNTFEQIYTEWNYIGTWNWEPSWKKQEFMVLNKDHTYTLGKSRGTWKTSRSNGQEYLILTSTNPGEFAACWCVS